MKLLTELRGRPLFFLGSATVAAVSVFTCFMCWMSITHLHCGMKTYDLAPLRVTSDITRLCTEANASYQQYRDYIKAHAMVHVTCQRSDGRMPYADDVDARLVKAYNDICRRFRMREDELYAQLKATDDSARQADILILIQQNTINGPFQEAGFRQLQKQYSAEWGTINYDRLNAQNLITKGVIHADGDIESP